MIITLSGADFSGDGNNINGVRYTITFVCKDESGATLTSTSSNKKLYSEGANITFTSSNVPIVNGYTFKSASPASITVTANATVTVTYSISSSGGGEPVTPPSEPSVPDTLTLLAQNGSGVIAFSRLAKNAYVANMKQMFSAGSTIGYIEIPLVSSKKLVTTETTIPEFNLWVFNAETYKPVEKIISGQSYTSQNSNTFGCHTIKVNVNRSFDYPFFFGYSNLTGDRDTGIAYYSESHNYLSGTEFSIGTAIAESTGSVVIYCAIYGEGSIYTPVIPDDVNGLTQIAYYNESASSLMAGNCYIAVSDNTVPANTKITTLDIKAGFGKVEGLNVYVVNADTDTIIEMLQNEATVDTVYSSRIDSDVVRLNVDKTYTHPVYFMFNSERTGSNKIGLMMKSGASMNSLLLTDDETKPAVGDVLSGFKSGYGIGHAIYS